MFHSDYQPTAEHYQRSFSGPDEPVGLSETDRKQSTLCCYPRILSHSPPHGVLIVTILDLEDRIGRHVHLDLVGLAL
jgi:hypothetical protein